MSFDRINLGTAIVIAALIAALVALVVWGPADQRGVATTALVGLAGALVAAFRGRLVRRDPGKFSAVLLVAALALGTSACTLGQALNAAELLASKIACAVEHQDLSNEEIIAKCATQPGDAERILAIVGESRKAAARAKVAACGPTADAGAP